MFGKKNKYLVITIVGLVILALLGLLSRFFIRKDADDIKNKYELTSCNVLHHSTIYENFYNQSIVIYNNKIYTFYCDVENNGFVEVRDVKTDKVYNSMPVNIGHGNSSFVSSIWHDENDDTPLIFVAHCTVDNKITALYFKDNIAYEYKTYSFNPVYSGYLASFVIDNDKNIGYTLGTAKGYTGYSQNANSVIGVFDLSKEISLDDGTYSFALIETYEIEEIPFKQDVDFYDGRIWILTCDLDTEFTKYVYGINVKTKKVDVLIDDFITNKISSRHGEGITFYNDRLYLNAYLGYTIEYKFN